MATMFRWSSRATEGKIETVVAEIKGWELGYYM